MGKEAITQDLQSKLFNWSNRRLEYFGFNKIIMERRLNQIFQHGDFVDQQGEL
jgi:hypothetical protein